VDLAGDVAVITTQISAWATVVSSMPALCAALPAADSAITTNPHDGASVTGSDRQGHRRSGGWPARSGILARRFVLRFMLTRQVTL
jgi:hypothetical protein